MFAKSSNLGIFFCANSSVYCLTPSEMKVESMLPAKDVTGALTGILALAVAKASLAHLKIRIWQILRPNCPWSKCRHAKVSSSGGSGVRCLLTCGVAACLMSGPDGAQPPGGGRAGRRPLCADTFPPCHLAIATPVALAAVVVDPFEASGGGPSPSMGGPNPSLEVVVVEDVPPVVGPDVNPLLWGDIKASVDGVPPVPRPGINPSIRGDTKASALEVPPVLGPGVHPALGGDTKAVVDVLAGALPPVVVPHGGGGGLAVAAVLPLAGGQHVLSLQRLLISCHWIVGNSSFCRSITSWAVTPLWRSSA